MKKTPPSSSKSSRADLVSPEEIKATLNAEVPPLPSILNLAQAAKLSHYTPGTLRKLVSEGRFDGSAIRGKPLLFWRNTFACQIVNSRPRSRKAPKSQGREQTATEPLKRKVGTMNSSDALALGDPLFDGDGTDGGA